MGFLIDSSAFIVIDRQQGSLENLKLHVGQSPIGIASVTVSELLVGLFLSPVGARRRRRELFINSILDDVSILPLDLNVARVHAQFWADLQRRGLMIGRHDLIIAATAVTHGLVVLTHNVREFNRVPGLSVQRADF